MNLQVATVSVQGRHFDREDLRQLQTKLTKTEVCSDEELRSRNVLLALKLLLHVSSK